LEMHWASDVAGGFTLGLAYVLSTICLVEALAGGRGASSETEVELADGEGGVADVESVVVSVWVGLALEVEPIERQAARDLEAYVPQIEPDARVEPHLAIEDLIGLVVAIRAVEVIAVPLESDVRA